MSCLRWLLVIAWLALAGLKEAGAQTVEYHGGPGSLNVANSLGEPLSDGNEVRIGYFTGGLDVAASSGNLNELGAAWREFHQTKIEHIFDQPGRFSADASRFEDDFGGQKIYLWILQTADNGPAAPGHGNVVAYGLYSSRAENWVFPFTDAVPPANSTLLATFEVDQAFYGTFNDQSLVLKTVSSTGEMPLAQWKQASFSASATETDKADGADPDQDGLPNLAEYLLGLNPVQADVSAASPQREMVDGLDSLSLVLTLRKDRPNAAMVSEKSTDLRAWTTNGVKVQTLEEAAETKRVRVSIPMEWSSGYLRLGVEPR